ncbi:MAG: F0F1 ATP synthase subunit A [bacterium]|nr:F0F1 ATP synthase subunit A [bacterium]
MASENSNQMKNETTIFAEPIFHVGNFTITNSLLNSWLAVIVLVLFFIFVSRKIRRIPRGIQNLFEAILEMSLKFSDSITGSRKKSEKFVPICLTFFLFILVNNYLGLLPFVGSIGFIENVGGERTFIPMFRGATADLNTTLALAIIAIVSSHIIGVKSVGFQKHLNKFVKIKAIFSIPKNIKKDWTILLSAPINVFVGFLEIIGEFSRIASLSFRLFGNIFAGEVLISSIIVLIAWAVPVPFMFLEIFVGLIQALVFSTLTMVFMTMNSQVHDH